MKTLKSILLLAFITCAFLSCKDDDDNGGASGSGMGSFTYDGSNFALDKGSVINYGGAGNSFNFDIILGSPSLNFDQFGDLDGSGDSVYFELWTDQQSGLKSGTYSYDSSSEADFTFTIGQIGVGCDNNGTCTFQDDSRSGTVTINRSGSNYDISFNLTMNGGEVITGSYDGSLRSLSDL
jgi:hypothetical protein